MVNEKNIVNIVTKKQHDLGYRLTPGFPFKIETIFGTVGNLRNAMEFIVTPDYPTSLLSKSKLKPSEISRIPTRKILVVNYYAIVAYLLLERVEQDPELITLMINNTLPFASVFYKNKEYYGKTITVGIENTKLRTYVKICSDISLLIKAGDFSNANKREELINSYKNKKDVGVFDGLPFIVS